MHSYSVRPAPGAGDVWRLPDELHALRPEAAHLLESVNERAWQCVDPALLELVRLRTAQLMTAKIDFYERSDLPDRCKVALRITDAFIIQPDLLTGATVAEARATFDPEQLAELCLDITKWSTQKIHVALGTDGVDSLPVNEAGTAYFSFDDSGRVAGFSAS